MKKLDIAKTIQLIIFLILTLVSIDLVLLDPELYHMAGSDTRVRFLCGVLWLVLLLSFAFLLTDFILLSSYKKDYRETQPCGPFRSGGRHCQPLQLRRAD